ncbi:MAG: hypothetical protein JO194_01885 [Candidatus Eremiobacteraeota bacterium]|nr:hypothetical protein [Candidatus Eremiobacteraeota bacterium]
MPNNALASLRTSAAAALLLSICVTGAAACARPAGAPAQQRVTLAAASADPAPDPSATPLAHFPIWIYSGCSNEFIKEYNPELSFRGAAAKNADFLENTNSAPLSGSRCGQVAQPTNQQACALSQSPLPGEARCVPVVYFTATNAGKRSGCNNADFLSRRGTTDADWYHYQRPLSNATIATNDRYCSGAGSQILVPNSADFESWLTTSAASPMNGAPSNQAYFRDDVYACHSSCIGSLVSYVSQHTVAECADDPCALAAESALNAYLAPRAIFQNSFGGGGLGFSNVAHVPMKLYTDYKPAGNIQGVITEQCLTDTKGVNKSGGCIAIINSCTKLFAAHGGRCVFLNNASPNAGGTLGARRAALAILWLTYAAVQPYGASAWSDVVSFTDIGGGGVSADDVDIYPEDDIWPDPRAMRLPSGQPYMREFTYSGSGPGSGCPGDERSVGGMADELIPGSCASSSNAKPAGVYAVEFADCRYQWTSGGAKADLGGCAVVWNPTNAPYVLSAGKLHYTYANQLQMNGDELRKAIGGTLQCRNCEGSIQSAPVSFPATISAGDALILVRSTFGPL